MPATGGLPAVNLAAGDTLTVNLAGHAFDGATSAGNTFIFSAPAGGGDTILSGNSMPTFNVATASDLTSVVNAIDVGGFFSSVNTGYVINLTADVAATAGLPAIKLAVGDTLTIDTNGHLLDGATNGTTTNFTFAATGPGGSTVLTGNAVPTFNVASATDLVAVSSVINSGDLLSSPNTDYVINLTADVPLTPNLAAFNLAAGDTLTIHTDGHLLDGATNGAGADFKFATTGPGGSTVLTAHAQPNFNVSSGAALADAFQAISSGGLLAATNTNYVIDLTGNIALTANLPTIALGTGDTLTINGAGHFIDGGGTFSGIYLQSGSLTLSNLEIERTVETGGAGGAGYNAGGGGGGLGAGGGLFVGSGASATLDNVIVTHSTATGGAGGRGASGRYRGPASVSNAGGGGFVDSRSPYSGGSGARYAGGRDVLGNSGGLGGGGGGSLAIGLHAYIGGGSGGYGAGNGGGASYFAYGGGGGGAGLGGGIFVAAGGSLTLGGGSISGNSAVGGLGGAGFASRYGSVGPGSSGLGIGTGLFTASQTVNLAPALGQTLTISDSIAGGGSGIINIAGPGSVVLSGAITGTTIEISGSGAVTLPTGTLVNDSFEVAGSAHYTLTNAISGSGTLRASGTSMLIVSSANSLTGGMVLDGSSTIELNSATAAGSGVISFMPNAGATLIIEPGDTPSNQINGFNPGDAIEFVGFGANATATMGLNNIVTVSDGLHTAALHFNPGVDMSFVHFGITAIAGGVLLTDSVPFAITTLVGQPVGGGGARLQGTAAPQSTVSIIVDGSATVIGTGTADSSGHFDITTSALADGRYLFQAMVTAGASTQTSADFPVNVLPHPPAITTLIASNPLNGDTVELKGTGGAIETVKLYLDGSPTVFATTTTDGDGNFDIITPALADGHHTFTATQTNGQGFTSLLSAGFTVDVKPTAPTLSGLVGQPVNGGHITVSGSGEAGETIWLFADGGTTVVGTGGIDSNTGQFSFATSATFTDGVHTLTAVTVNSAGLVSGVSNVLPVDVDPSSPAIATLVGQPVNGGTIEVQGTGEANEILTVFADGGTTPVYLGTIDSSGTFDITTLVPFADGIHHLTATVTNSLNFTSPVSSPFTVNVLPATPVISSVANVPGTPQQIEVQGTAKVGDTIRLFADGGTTVLASSVVIDPSGHFDLFAGILAGTHTITATETDSAGLASAISSGVSLDVTPNAPTNISIVGQPVNGGTVEVKGSVSALSTVTIYQGNTVVGTHQADAGGHFDFSTSATFADGVYTLTATATNASQTSPSSTAFTVSVVPSVPAISAVNPIGPQQVEITGSGEAGDTINFFVDGSATPLGSVVADALTGAYDFTTSISGGLHTIKVSDTDGAGLTGALSAASSPFHVAPIAPVIGSAIGQINGQPRPQPLDASHQFFVSGTGEAGDTIKLYADGGATAIGTGSVAPDGTFRVQTSVLLSDGSHTLTATDAAGADVSALSAGLTVYVDPAAVTGVAQVGIAAYGGTIELTGNGQAGDTITLMLGSTVIGTGTVDATTGQFDVTSSPADPQLFTPGSHQIAVTQTDSLGHTGPAVAVNVLVGAPPPHINSVLSVPDPTGRVEVKGTGDAGSTITLYADHNTTTAIGTGTVGANGQFDIYSAIEQLTGGRTAFPQPKRFRASPRACHRRRSTSRPCRCRTPLPSRRRPISQPRSLTSISPASTRSRARTTRSTSSAICSSAPNCRPSTSRRDHRSPSRAMATPSTPMVCRACSSTRATSRSTISASSTPRRSAVPALVAAVAARDWAVDFSSLQPAR